MFRYHLRTLLIVLALGPPVLAGAWLVGCYAWVRWNTSSGKVWISLVERAAVPSDGPPFMVNRISLYRQSPDEP